MKKKTDHSLGAMIVRAILGKRANSSPDSRQQEGKEEKTIPAPLTKDSMRCGQCGIAFDGSLREWHCPHTKKDRTQAAIDALPVNAAVGAYTGADCEAIQTFIRSAVRCGVKDSVMRMLQIVLFETNHRNNAILAAMKCAGFTAAEACLQFSNLPDATVDISFTPALNEVYGDAEIQIKSECPKVLGFENQAKAATSGEQK